MAKEEMIEMKGVVTEVLPDSRYRITLENGHSLIAYTAGKMRLHRIRIIEGDKVTVELSPYDMNKARVTFRHIDGKQGAGAVGLAALAEGLVPPRGGATALVLSGGNIDATLTGNGGNATLTSMSGDVVLHVPHGFGMKLDLEIAFTKNSSKDYRIVAPGGTSYSPARMLASRPVSRA